MRTPARLRPRRYGRIDCVLSVKGSDGSSRFIPSTKAAASNISVINPIP